MIEKPLTRSQNSGTAEFAITPLLLIENLPYMPNAYLYITFDCVLIRSKIQFKYLISFKTSLLRAFVLFFLLALS